MVPAGHDHRSQLMLVVLHYGLPTIATVTVTAQFAAARTAMTYELRIQLVFPETEVGNELSTQLADNL